MSISSTSRGHQSAPDKADPGQNPDTPATSTPKLPLRDPFLTLKVQEAFAADPALKNAPIDIDVLGGAVHLTGIVRTQCQQTIAIYVAAEVKGVNAISNGIQIVPPRREPDRNSETSYRNCHSRL